MNLFVYLFDFNENIDYTGSSLFTDSLFNINVIRSTTSIIRSTTSIIGHVYLNDTGANPLK